MKFIIISPARAGSTALRMSLDRHPAIVCNGEYYAPNRVIGWNAHHDLSPDQILQFRRDNPKQFLDQYAFCDAEHSGFKILYNQLLQLGFMTTAALIKSDPSIRVIHLWRDDLCSRFISEKRLVMQYENRGSTVKDLRIRLSPKEMLHDCRNQILMKKRVEAMFKDRPVLEIAFEKLADSMSLLEDFLGVAKDGPKVELAKEKQDYKNDISVTVENADELRAAYNRWLTSQAQAPR